MKLVKTLRSYSTKRASEVPREDGQPNEDTDPSDSLPAEQAPRADQEPPSATAAAMAPTTLPPTTWSADELAGLDAAAEFGSGPAAAYAAEFSKFNPTPGTGRTGFLPVPPNNYPFYTGDARYTPVMQPDGGQLSEWAPMYAPSKEQAEEDRQRAYEARVPHGYVAPGNRLEGLPTITLTVVSELHDESEYGADVGPDGRHSGGPFTIEVSPKMRVEELRAIIRDVGGVLPALQRLSYAGKHLDDAQRTLEQYGLAYWAAKFPGWPLKLRKH
ncbi:MAG: hypothetical protein J3K34DRAFT_415633 [Monoraphidium minutum]|nr:MAG: hypothetical protein J3K34DRAFT_415633 [Monoraphidium minutum]